MKRMHADLLVVILLLTNGVRKKLNYNFVAFISFEENPFEFLM